ncbi:MAG: GNAT family N-acetyltransferase [Spirochaetales bacterium]|nr:GNAT family N-acetyltransferase [Spirochaetales bacterium]
MIRELASDDVNELSEVLSDPRLMIYYPRPFTRDEIIQWIDRNIGSYKRYNYGLWAVILKENEDFLGDCGITIQEIEGRLLPEIGYHIKRAYCGKGYATEAAAACIDYAFHRLNIDTLYMFTKLDNIPSIRVGEKIGMKFVKKFNKKVMGVVVREVLYRINKEKRHDT